MTIQHITENELQQIEEAGRLLITEHELGLMIGLGSEEIEILLEDLSHPVCAAYQRGKLETKMSMNKFLLDQAKSGSLTAIERLAKLL